MATVTIPIGPSSALSPLRLCSGGARQRCGAVATVVCTSLGKRTTRIVSRTWFHVVMESRLQWFACDDVEHHDDATTTPIGEWFAMMERARK